MKASKFSEAQIAFVLKQVEGSASVAEVCRKAGVSQATSNSVFEVLEEWESHLKAIEIDIPSSESRTPPAPRLRGPSL